MLLKIIVKFEGLLEFAADLKCFLSRSFLPECVKNSGANTQYAIGVS
ncbi:hypothetical protein SAMN03097708_00272 [Thiohalomonas denitrificans]|uniref:Uncharacterized protein n=1 Tax=Thiohalomonas denitrificans TaxID=415747 RepID=A0A1G5PJZ0_9GAMM|nr:hypothetical protein SAMN03097708_00272 [Thiohalomonas denitrificans]